MRVVGGEWRGRPLVAPAGRATRPTSDKVREAVFGVLGALPAAAEAAAAFGLAAAGGGAPTGHVALDLFAGSGGLGIEALSRGAAHCTFVERERAAVKALRANLGSLGVPVWRAARAAAEPPWPPPARARIVAADARRALTADAARGALYTLVFVDPPYDRYAEVRPALARLLTPLLAPSAVVVVETAAGTAPELPWAILREKRYGDTRVTFLVAPAGDTTKE